MREVPPFLKSSHVSSLLPDIFYQEKESQLFLEAIIICNTCMHAMQYLSSFPNYSQLLNNVIAITSDFNYHGQFGANYSRCELEALEM